METDTSIFPDLKPSGLFLPNVEDLIARANMQDPDGRIRLHDKPHWREHIVVRGSDVEEVKVIDGL